MVSSSATAWVPVVDLANTATVVDEVVDACERVGFLTVVGHGVDDQVLRNCWIEAQSFFDLPIAEKMKVAMPRPGYPYGYSPLTGESLAASLGKAGHPDLKESFAIGPVDPPTHAITDPDEWFAWSANIWPASLARFRHAWEEYYRAMADLAARLLRIMAKGLSLHEDYFDPMICRHTSAMRALNYPPAGSTKVLPGQLGAGAHTDYGTLTVLLADPVEAGLQVEGMSGVWHDIKPQPGALVVNLGDAMARWTNDRWRSTMHRVLVPQGRRQSIAFFHNANWDAIIECIPSCLADGEGPRYPPIGAGPHLMSKFQSTVNVVEQGQESKCDNSLGIPQ